MASKKKAFNSSAGRKQEPIKVSFLGTRLADGSFDLDQTIKARSNAARFARAIEYISQSELGRSRLQEAKDGGWSYYFDDEFCKKAGIGAGTISEDKKIIMTSSPLSWLLIMLAHENQHVSQQERNVLQHNYALTPMAAFKSLLASEAEAFGVESLVIMEILKKMESAGKTSMAHKLKDMFNRHLPSYAPVIDELAKQPKLEAGEAMTALFRQLYLDQEKRLYYEDHYLSWYENLPGTAWEDPALFKSNPYDQDYMRDNLTIGDHGRELKYAAAIDFDDPLYRGFSPEGVSRLEALQKRRLAGSSGNAIEPWRWVVYIPKTASAGTEPTPA